jgi:hypothetical protein
MKIGVVAWGKSNCFGVKWQVVRERARRDKRQETRSKKQEARVVCCRLP